MSQQNRVTNLLVIHEHNGDALSLFLERNLVDQCRADNKTHIWKLLRVN